MRSRCALAAFLLALAAAPIRAQEMEPRAYSPTPVGTNFAAVIAGWSEGDVLFDPSIPITDVSASLGTLSVGYGRTFGMFGRPALVVAVLPYVRGDVEGQVLETARRVERSGLADLRLKLSVSFLGPGAMTPQEFPKAPKRTVVGGSLTVQAPIGEYDETKLINLGTNRWAFKPELGVSVPVGRWYLDGYLGVWLFTSNDHFFPGNAVREQDPLTTVQAHASYTFRSHSWMAFDATWYGGGESTTNGGPETIRQSNTRLGATFSLPITPKQSLKFAGSTGAAVRIGSSFDTFLVGWQVLWFDR